MYPLLVATRELHAFRTAHMMVRAEGMQLKHRSSVRVHGGRRKCGHPVDRPESNVLYWV